MLSVTCDIVFQGLNKGYVPNCQKKTPTCSDNMEEEKKTKSEIIQKVRLESSQKDFAVLLIKK